MKRILVLLLALALAASLPAFPVPALAQEPPARIDLPADANYISLPPLALHDGTLLVPLYKSDADSYTTLLCRYAPDGSLLWSTETAPGNSVWMTEQADGTVELAFFRMNGWQRQTRRYAISDGSLASEGPLFLPEYDRIAQENGVKPGMYVVVSLGDRFLRKERNPHLQQTPRYTTYELETWEGRSLWRLPYQTINVGNFPSVTGLLSAKHGTLIYGGRTVGKAKTTTPAALLVDDNGVIQWEYVSEASASVVFPHAAQLTDGSLLLTDGYLKRNRPKVEQGGWAVKLDGATGKLLWQARLGPEQGRGLVEEQAIETPWGLLLAGGTRAQDGCACWLLDHSGQTLAYWETPYAGIQAEEITDTHPFLWNGALWAETRWRQKNEYAIALMEIHIPQ